MAQYSAAECLAGEDREEAASFRRAMRLGTLDAASPDMDNKKVLVSIGTAIAASKIAKAVSHIELNDVLGTVGLSRRRSHFLADLGLVAVGAIVGAGAALLLAPSSGSVTRSRLSAGASRLGQAAMDAAREQKDEALRSLSQVANGAVSSDHS